MCFNGQLAFPPPLDSLTTSQGNSNPVFTSTELPAFRAALRWRLNKRTPILHEILDATERLASELRQDLSLSHDNEADASMLHQYRQTAELTYIRLQNIFADHFAKAQDLDIEEDMLVDVRLFIARLAVHMEFASSIYTDLTLQTSSDIKPSAGKNQFFLPYTR